MQRRVDEAVSISCPAKPLKTPLYTLQAPSQCLKDTHHH